MMTGKDVGEFLLARIDYHRVRRAVGLHAGQNQPTAVRREIEQPRTVGELRQHNFTAPVAVGIPYGNLARLVHRYAADVGQIQYRPIPSADAYYVHLTDQAVLIDEPLECQQRRS